MASPRNYRKVRDRKVRELPKNRKGRFGEVMKWKHKDKKFYVAVSKYSDGGYEVSRGSNPNSKEHFVISLSPTTKTEARKEAIKWMKKNPNGV